MGHRSDGDRLGGAGPDHADESATLILDPSGSDYDSVSSTALTVTVTDDDSAVTGICSRTAEVQTALLDATSRTACADVTAADLVAVTSLTVSNYSGTSLDPADFAGLTGLTSLEIDDSPQLTTVPDNAFAGLTALTTLDFSFLSSLTTLAEDAFDGLTALETLNLEYTDLTALDADLFDGLTALETLYLNNNSLTTLDADLFDGLTVLETLYLTSNLLTTLNADIFDSLTALETLGLGHNGLTTLDADIFDDLTALRILGLSVNGLTTLDADIFDDLTAMETLALDNNGLTTLDADLFDGLTALETLYLNNNLLTTLDADLFDGLTTLEELYLSSNLLTTMDADLFDGLTALTKLYLNSNLLTTMDADLFDGLTALSDLRLDQNSLGTMDADIFDGLTALTILALQDNRLTALDADIFDGISLLDRLDLNCNYFTALDLNIFNPFAATLTALNLQSDSFTTPPTAAAIRAKFSIEDFSIGVTTCSRVTVSPTSLTVDEGATGTLSVALRSLPTDVVTLAISSDNPDVTVTPTTALTFTVANWDTAQTVTVSAAQDPDQADESATLILDPDGDGDKYPYVVSTPLTVTVTDDDTDTTAPTVASIARQNPTSSPTNADSLTWRVTFSEAVSNVNAADFAVSGTTATVTAVATVSGVTGAYDVTASGGNLASVNATVALTIAASHDIEDGASNALSNRTPTGTNNNSYVLDNTAPSVTISGVPSASDAPFTATFTFSEAVTGFAAGDITLSNASVSNFTATCTTVSALVTVTASNGDGLSANAARDAAGNGNTAAARASSTYTGTAALPAITTAGTSPVAGVRRRLHASRTGMHDRRAGCRHGNAGGDMVAASNEGDRTVTFLANSTTVTLSIATVSDSVAEANSVVTATVAADTGSPASYSVAAPGSAMVTVRDDDSTITASVPTVTLRTQSVPESIGTAMLVVTLDQPASAPLSVPWYTLSSTAASPGDYTNGAGTLIIPSGVTNATISITIIDDAVEEPTETVLVLLSPGDGYELGGSGATVSILDDDGDGPAPSGATVDGATVVLTYNEPLDGASTPSSTAFVLRVAGDPVSINEVSVDGSEVTLTLAAPVPAGQTVSLDYTAPMSNPIQDASGNKAQSFTRWYLVTESTITITNPVITVPGAPTALSATAVGNTQINLSWTAPGENGGAPISGYKIESSPDGVANWTELVANTGNANTTYEHLGLTFGTTRHYRVSAINSVGAGDPSNIDDAIASIPSLSLRTQTVLESIGTAVLAVTLDQPAGDPLSVPWYTLSVHRGVAGRLYRRGGTLIIPPRTTNATISITIINDADEEPTETFLVLLSPGEGYDLGGSGATVSILDDDGDGPAPIRATVNGTTVVLTYNKPLDGASTPSSTAFHLRVAGDPVSINEVSVDGSEVTLTLAAPVPAGQTVSLDYTQPMSNPIQDGSGNKAQSFTRWYLVTGSTITGTVDTTAPSVTISGVPAISDAPFTATFTFSEAVTGFAVGDITLGNATASSFTSTSTTVYRALVTPTAAGAVTVDVPANAAQDAAGNGNTAATRASSTYTGSATRGVTVFATVLTSLRAATGTYTVVLDSQPTANVTVTPSRTGSTDVTFSPATLTFTALNWNTVQPVTVTAAQDSDAVDDSATISHAVTGGDYVGVTVESVVVRVNDDESVDTVPGVPTDLSASTGGDTRINLSWTAPGDDGGSPITGYKIEVSPDGNANWTGLVANTGNTTTTYAHIGLAVGTTRHYRVSAINSVGAGDPSNIDDATTRPITGPITGGGGGGGGPTPSEVDFEWNVKRDIEELDGGNDRATGVWSDGTTLWVADNADGAGDAVYAYDLASGERVESREFALADTNRAPRGIWSDGETAWVSDSGRERLFAYRLADGERLEEREFELPRENRDARGIWSDEKTMWVLDGRADALFAYDFESGELLAEYALDAANDDPRGIWSDGVTIWVSDHGAKRLFAYRLPVLPDAETDSGAQGADDDARELERVRDEEFSMLSRASNNSPRGIWSDGDVMYVADESDDRVYSYNMPDAADARLASLTLSGVDIGEFDPGRTEYEAVVADGVTATTVEAEAMQRRTDVAIDPPDIDEAAEGYQVALEDLGEITVTVTSADGSRTKTYRVRLGEEEAAGPVAGCLRGDIAVGFSLVVYAGGSIEDLVACAEGRNVAALYVLDGGEWVSYILGAPEFVNRSFAGLFAEGLAALTPLIARSDGPATAAPGASGVTGPWAACLRGEIVEGFNLVVYEGGSVGDAFEDMRGGSGPCGAVRPR